MLEVKTEVRIIGHILEREVIFKLSKDLDDIDVEVMHCEVSFAALKAGIEEKMPSVMRFYLVGAKEDREKALSRIKKIAEETECRIDYAKEKKGRI
jgi:ACT domain-containing protein